MRWRGREEAGLAFHANAVIILPPPLVPRCATENRLHNHRVDLMHSGREPARKGIYDGLDFHMYKTDRDYITK